MDLIPLSVKQAGVVYVLSKSDKSSNESLMDLKKSFKNGSKFIGALINNNLVGYVRYKFLKKLKDTCSLEHICVKKDYRRKGVAGALIDVVINECRRNKKRKIELGVDLDNNSALNFYKKNGFKIISYHMRRTIKL